MPGFRDECAVFGIWGDPEAGRMAYLGLYAQQHRGQESSGIVTLHDEQHLHHKGIGLVGEVFDEDNLQRLQGTAAIGHNRYSTTGENLITNAQPLTAILKSGPVAVAHNGNIVNASLLREELIGQGAIFQGTNDTEVVLHMLSRNSNRDFIQCLQDAASRIEGAYSFTFLTNDCLVAMRDPYGFRPLILGRRKLENGKEAVVIASETCALDLIGARYEREIEPGEIFWATNQGEFSKRVEKNVKKLSQCVFEHVYFSRPDSIVFGKSVYEARKSMGHELAKESPVAADLVIPVPDSGVPAALGYSIESKIPFELGIIRNHYIGRTFIQPSQSIRNFAVKIKLNPQTHILKGKSVVIIDDSLVRGTTSQKIIRMIRQAGAKEVHFRLASPPSVGSCFYGVDTPKRSQLIASHKSIDEICKFIGADSLAYLSVEGLLRAVGEDGRGFCTACFTGNYPTDLYGLDRE
ncbi:MAG: amidophosphoribosyltransferase [Bdellovibrionales bacterium RBG_16_40_8]|nr:MAG: amidophosphoribosyltransferase [Bdellovibrionales bacterium RBG_16_40_8]